MSNITFPLKYPTHYLACVDGKKETYTHVAIKFSLAALIRLTWMYVVSFCLSVLQIHTTSFSVKAEKLGVSCLNTTSRKHWDGGQASSDDSPYESLSLGELISLGGYATQKVITQYFNHMEYQIESIDIHVNVSGTAWFTVYTSNSVIETETFNVKIFLNDYIKGVLRP